MNDRCEKCGRWNGDDHEILMKVWWSVWLFGSVTVICLLVIVGALMDGKS